MEVLPVESPPIDTADLCAFKSDADMQDLLREKASCASRVVIIVRLLGRGVPGFQHLLDYCHNPKPASSSTTNTKLVSGVPGSFEPDLGAMCNVSNEIVSKLTAYFHADGCATNMFNLWKYVGDSERNVNGTAGRTTRIPTVIVAVLFYRCHYLSGNTAFVVNAIGLFSESLREEEPCDNVNGISVTRFPITLQYLLEPSTGVNMADVLISTMAFAMGEVNPDGPTLGSWSTAAISALNMPVLQAMTSCDTRESWENAARGLNPLDTAMNVAIPEFDRRIISVP